MGGGEESGAPTLEETGKCDTWAAVRVIPGRGRWWDRSTKGLGSAEAAGLGRSYPNARLLERGESRRWEISIHYTLVSNTHSMHGHQNQLMVLIWRHLK
jgi:hypothetical protein